MFYVALNSRNDLFIAKTMLDLGIEVEPDVDMPKEELIRMMPIYANGLLDTAPLPEGVDINPFSENSPLKKVPIKKFNSELFMILRTMGLLRALTETVEVHRSDCFMSALFRPYAIRGLRMRGQSENDHRRRVAAVRASLTTGVSSPFEKTSDTSCNTAFW